MGELQRETLPPYKYHYHSKIESIVYSVKNRAELLNEDLSSVAISYYLLFTKSQAYFNANKRMAIVNTRAFLLLNDYEINIPWRQFIDLTLMVVKDPRPVEVIKKELLPILSPLIVPKTNESSA